MATKLPIWDERMLAVMDYCIANRIKCTNQKEFCKIIAIGETSVKQIKDGKSSFRHQHILNAHKKFGIVPNYFYGLTKNMFEKPIEKSPLAMIKEAVRILESK